MRPYVLVLGAIALAAAQGQQPVILSGVTMVPLDVRVLDRDGRLITDLKAGDFTITEDGVRQIITHFAARELTPDPEGAKAPLGFVSESKADALSSQSRRIILFVIGRGRHQAFKHIDALANFLGTSLMPQDLVAITAYNRTTAFTGDHARLREVAERFADRHERIETLLGEWFSGLRGQMPRPKIPPPHVQKEIDWVFEPAAAASTAAIPHGHPDFVEFRRRFLPEWTQQGELGALIAGINYLRFLEGEKRIVILTEFAASLPRPVQGGGLPAMASSNRIAIDILQTGGTVGAPRPFYVGSERRRLIMPNMPSTTAVTMFAWKLQDARETAAATGGLGSLLKRGKQAFTALAAVTGFHYSLAYSPTNASRDGKYRVVKVTVARPGVRVLAREGYFATDRAEPLDLREYAAAERLREAAQHRDALEGIRVSVLGITRIAVDQLEAQVRIDPAGITSREEAGLRVVALDVALRCTDDRRRIVGEMQERLDLKLTPAGWEEATANGLVVSLRVALKGYARDVKAIVYDFAGDNLGSAIVRLQDR